MQPPRRPHYSISVSNATYQRLRAQAPLGGLTRLVEQIIVQTLNDPETSERAAARCRADADEIAARRSRRARPQRRRLEQSPLSEES